MSNLFKIYTRAIIINWNNDVLLIKKRENQKLWWWEWLLPWWTLEFWENIEHTLVREIKEEINLDVKEINLLSHKKMIIWDTHWLWIYFLCKVKDEKSLTNMEPEKHETVWFFSLQDIPKMKDYMMIKMLYNFSKEFFDITTCDWKQHSMQKHLFKYVESKVHSLIKENIDNINYIQIIWNYDRSHIVSKEEKNDKPFNFKRPTAFIDSDTLFLSCFPWEDYVKHYANIIATYYYINNKKTPLISYRLPNKDFIYNVFYENWLNKIPNCDTIIFWNIDKIWLFEDKKFIKNWDFSFKEWVINNKRVILLWCEFSIWWNTWEYLIEALSNKINFNNFIYIWKLWVLDKNIEPNKFLATWNSSYINWEEITWNNIFTNLKDKNIIYAKHITCYSVIEEGIYNIWEYKKFWNFIDPEIWNMAKSCNQNWKNFSYLHIISDNVNIPYEENLSNERKKEIIEKRKDLFKQIWTILLKVI